MSNNQIYLDHAAATPLDEHVLKAMLPYFSEQFYNPSATYLSARHVADCLNEARARIAVWLGARPGEIIFTAGGTEANNIAIHGIMQRYTDANMVVSAVEHESVLRPAEKYQHKLVNVGPDGVVDIEKLAKAVDDKTVLVSVMYANNEVGTIEPIRRIAEILEAVKKERRNKKNDMPLYLHTDACQAAQYLDLHAARLGIDLMTINGGKLYGPKQSGALFVKAGVILEPYILGGGQEHNLRSGTENVAGAIGLATALETVQNRRHRETKRLQKLQKTFIDLLTANTKIEINGSLKTRLPNNVHITVAGQDNERLMMQLDEQNILCAVGSACSASNEEPSHVLRAMGLTDEAAQASLRFTMGRTTTLADIERTVKVLTSFL